MPKSAKSFRPHLTLGDVAITSHGPLVTLQFTEAIQFGGRHLHIPLLAVIPCFSLFTPLRMIRLVPARRSVHPCPIHPHQLESSKSTDDSTYRKSSRKRKQV